MSALHTGGAGPRTIERVNKTFAFSLVAAVVLTGALVASRTKATSHAPQVSSIATAAPTSEQFAKVRDADIALYERRLTEDPESAADRSRLASLYLRRARETGNFLDVERATKEARQSLALREGHNQATFGILASAQLAQHDFVGALGSARALVRDDPETPAHHALLGEVLLELGKYDEAAAEFAVVEGASTTLGTAPRLARWYEVTGRLDRACAMSRYAIRLSRERDDLTPEQQAWFLMRAGDLEFKRGAMRVADSLYQVGLAMHPDDYRILAARARLAAAQGRWQEVVTLGESVIAIQLEPGTLGLLRDAYDALGDRAQAESYASAMTASALTQPGPIHRAWGLHLVDHHERLSDVLARVRREQVTRHDVYGYDLEGWTLHAMGRDTEAWSAIQRAVAQHTEDAMLWYHAGVIAAAVRQDDLARSYLGRALAVNPAFQVRGAVEARAVLARLSVPVTTQTP